MKKLKKIQLVQRYIIVDDELIYTTRDDDQNDQIVSNYLQLDLETWSDFLYIIDREHILVRLNTGLGMILNYYSGRYKYLNNFKSNNVSGSRIVFSRGGTFDQSFGVFNLSQNIEYFSTKELIGNTIFEDKIYSDFKNIISCRQVETGKLDWEFPLSVYGTYFQNGEDHPMKLRGFGGVYEGVLYLWAGVGLLLGIDVASGKEVFKFKLDEEKFFYLLLALSLENIIV